MDSFKFKRGELLKCVDGSTAIVQQRYMDCDTNEVYYRIQFAPYNNPPMSYSPEVAHTVFAVRGQQ